MVTLRTENGDFDLFEDNTIVQSISIFNFENIAGRNGDFSNLFDLPLTANNSEIIQYANYINTINTAPYQKINVQFLYYDFPLKSGFFIVEEISDTIKGRFISGNSNFYNLIKEVELTDLDWSAYDHVWNYTNALASRANTTGYVYPLITYNGQNLAASTLDVRKL